MVNFGLNFSSLLGLWDLLLAIAYLILSIVMLINQSHILGELGQIIYILQAIIAPLILLICGFILIFQGWRLDPILQFAIFLLHILVIYLGVKDVVIFHLVSQRLRR
ncbi:MAG: Ycf66 family protein [Xenococcaceae cyanobacterium]